MSEKVPPILIVDDLLDERLLIERIVHSCKLLNPVHLLETGGDCIRYFQQDAKLDEPQGCILFLDVMMQPTSGLKVLESIRDLPGARKSLIVMMSGLTDIKAINSGYQLGAQTFLIKPIKPEDIIQVINAMSNRVSIEENGEGYVLRLVPDTSTSFIKKAEIKAPFSNLAGRIEGRGAGTANEPPSEPGSRISAQPSEEGKK